MKAFFDVTTQEAIKSDPTLNNLTKSLLSGNAGYGVYDYGAGERLVTQSAIFIDGVPSFSIQLVKPSNEIYSQINQVLFTERMKMLSLLGGTAAVVA